MTFSYEYISISVLVLLILAERLLYLKEETAKYASKETWTNIALGLGFLFVSGFFKATSLAVYGFVYQFRLMSVGHAWWVWVLVFLANDFTCYWYHRASHFTNWFWTWHSVHHSCERYNLSVAVRQSWIGNLNGQFLFWIWLPLLGVEPVMVLIAYNTSLFYQTWLHTELIGKFPRAIEYIFNTPSHHRVHHACNKQYIDKNMGSMLIIWDRIFGTYAEEVEKTVYGLTKPVLSVNPFIVLWTGMKDLFRGAFGAASFLRGVKFLFQNPGNGQGAENRAAARIHSPASKNSLPL